MALHIRDLETDALVRELATRRRIGMTAAVKLAVRRELEREDATTRARLAGITDILDEVDGWPRTGAPADKAFFDALSGE